MNRISNPPKKVLLVQYSQSGQLSDITKNICEPLQNNDDIELQQLNLEMEEDFPFPWPLITFFNIFPECVYTDPPALKPFDVDLKDKYDLIILAYQVWFLAPALPTSAFLQSPEAKACLADTPVITVIGCRNMWTQAHLAVKRMLSKLGAHLIDNIVLIDQGSTMASFITTPRWVLTGKKHAFWGLPAAGVAEQEIKESTRFGKAIVSGLSNNDEKANQSLLHGLGAVNANVALIQSEALGYRSFRIWGSLLRRIGDQDSILRKFVLLFYVLFLVSMILTVVPVLLLVKLCLKPLFRNRYKKLKTQFEQPSGSSQERMDEFTCQR